MPDSSSSISNQSALSRGSENERDARIFALYEQLVEIEERLIPTGLHVFGRPSSATEKADLLKMVASFDRPEAGARALPWSPRRRPPPRH